MDPGTQPNPPPLVCFVWAHCLLKKSLHSCFAAYWAQSALPTYKQLAIPYIPHPPELTLLWPSLGCLLAARSRHGDFAEYHECFNHENALLTCSCGQHKTPQHFFHCLKGEATA